MTIAERIAVQVSFQTVVVLIAFHTGAAVILGVSVIGVVWVITHVFALRNVRT